MQKDTLTLTIRLHDPLEKQDAAKATSWVVIEVDRESLAMSVDELLERYFRPALPQLRQLKISAGPAA
jgi:hypothetical protein